MTTTTDQSRTFLWCVPRSTACAFTRAITATPGIEVWYEPFFFSFAARRDARKRLELEAPSSYAGNEEVFQQIADMLKGISHFTFKPEYLPFGSLKERMAESSSQHVFIKDMGFALDRNDFQFIPPGFKHTFLIRNPLRVLPSNRKSMFQQLSLIGLLEGDAAKSESSFDMEKDDPYMTDGFLFKEIYDVWQHVREEYDSDPVVIDADDFLTNPSEMMQKYCQAVGLPFDESLLSFGGPDLDVFKIWKSPLGCEELRMSVGAFSGEALTSTEFKPPGEMPARDQLTSDVIRCADQIMAYYDEMYEHRMKV